MSKESLIPFEKDQIWVVEQPINFSGFSFYTRMTIVKLRNGQLWVHSPVAIDDSLQQQIELLGEVRYIVAPSKLHHVHVSSFAERFPQAKTYATQGLQHKRKDFSFDQTLSDSTPEEWSEEIDQVVFAGNTALEEVEFYHRGSKTLIATDLIEHFPKTPDNANLGMKLMLALTPRFKHGCRSPEFTMFTRNKTLARQSLHKILEWDFEQAIIAHGELPGAKIRSMIEHSYRQILNV